MRNYHNMKTVLIIEVHLQNGYYVQMLTIQYIKIC
jgi:hypothetical protein